MRFKGKLGALYETYESILDAANLLKRFSKSVLQVANLGEIAYRMCHTTREQVIQLAKSLEKTEYCQFLLRVVVMTNIKCLGQLSLEILIARDDRNENN